MSQSGTDPRVPHQRWSVPVFIRFVKYCTISHCRIIIQGQSLSHSWSLVSARGVYLLRANGRIDCGAPRQKQGMTPWTTDARMVGCSRCSDDSSQKRHGHTQVDRACHVERLGIGGRWSLFWVGGGPHDAQGRRGRGRCPRRPAIRIKRKNRFSAIAVRQGKIGSSDF